MTRKRAVKLLMARGYSRNRANRIMQSKAPGDSNLQAYRTYLRCDSVCDTIAQLSRRFFKCLVSANALTEALLFMGEALAGR
jgi:hypothetical protein|uniref:Uncharacterized protein n=1 Tax=Caudovirales sp. ctlwr10 TaxID=2825771 RepID=A0A8S5Q4Y7_9CAUD|nr:MAG TPA: hypothetical protein [Caudovirales sp. ctlwr10]